ncbi:SulP family inorganic anion transporter [Helicobacter pylori]|uniref:SulP family inorganic anion transporter n=1 Tax=Helicobacter pylori TaxID=210 RepID=UPI0019336B70|nr:SulP family inorganic anion transporter [Helicobacter pylori]MBM0604119.1 SulP family inorganic anion transporter [Helicobacter pylori]MBM0614475.1 SulP family inorganic anion transporter [Helicobacter pylori]MBM0616091.1 SulP family inorganic anion transporter [Helicobacter pylori]MBM0618087.1 SulP family inorganic anion transporter [Helicobacter pylori]MBM0629691.1 SulP family inorganic anion transporter [Helicobacter pylori]
MLEKIQKEWLSNIQKDLLSGFVVGLSVIPETAGFAIMVGLDVGVAFYTTFYMAFVLSLFGARKAMISAAAGSVALILVGVVKNYGLEYAGVATLMAGILQILLGYLKIGNLLRFIPQSVMYGFVNALGILLLMEQFKFLQNQNLEVFILLAIGILIIYLFPLITKKIPSNLICILAVSAIALIFDMHAPNLGSIEQGVSGFHFIIIPKNLDFKMVVGLLPYALSLALVGTIESLLTAKTLDVILKDGVSDKNKETKAQGLGNIISGLLGGMTGCALVGQSIINAKSGAKTRLSTFFAGFSLMVLILVFNEYVVKIPIVAVVAVMVMISFTTFNFQSIINIKKIKLYDTLNMLLVVAVVLYTHNLAIGVVVGVLVNALWIKSKGIA